jgi:predicted DNA-binding transcriptional regulator AlpA
MKGTIVLGGQSYDSGVIVQDRYGLSAMTMYRWTKKGLLPPPIKLGGANYYCRKDVDVWLSRGSNQVP